MAKPRRRCHRDRVGDGPLNSWFRKHWKTLDNEALKNHRTVIKGMGDEDGDGDGNGDSYVDRNDRVGDGDGDGGYLVRRTRVWKFSVCSCLSMSVLKYNGHGRVGQMREMAIARLLRKA